MADAFASRNRSINMSNDTTTKPARHLEEDDRDLAGSFAFTSPREMMRESLVRLILSGEEDSARALAERDGLSFPEAQKKAEARRQAERDKAKAAAKEAERRAKASEKPAEPSDDSSWGLAGGRSDPNEGVPWGQSPAGGAWLSHFDPDLVEVVEVLARAYEAAKNAGVDWQELDQVAGHKIPVNAIVTRRSDRSEWYDSIEPHVEELGGNTELESEWVEEPNYDLNDEDDGEETISILHVSWTITWGVRKKLLKRFAEMAERLTAAANQQGGGSESSDQATEG
jgi:hypothetical protein